MRAAVFTEHEESLDVRDVATPDPAPDGVVVDVEACGICRSDWHAWVGDWGSKFSEGQIFGHEPAGTVAVVGEDVEHVREGDHVAVPFSLGDGSCDLCATGHSNICRNGRQLGFGADVQGAWAEQVHVPQADHNAVRLPDDVSSRDMAGLGCRFMTSFHALAHRADVEAGDWLAIHGCGGIGLSAVQIGSALGANVVAVDLMDEKLDIAQEMGAVATVDADTVDDVAGEIVDITDGGADVSVDALGIAATCRASVDCLDKLGQHVQIGLTTEDEGGEIPLPTDRIVSREIEFIGAMGMQPARYDEIFRMTATGKVDPAALITDEVGLDSITPKLRAMTEFETVGIPVVTEF